MVALHLIAALTAQKVELPFGLYPLGNGFHAQAGGQTNDGTHNGFVVRVGGDVTHKRLVNLELVNLEPFEVAQGRVAGAKVVNRQANAAPVQVVHHGNGTHRVVHGHPFGQLQLQPLGGQAGVAEQARHQLRQFRVPKLNRRQVHRQGDGGHAALNPLRQLGQGGANDPLANGQNQPAAFRNRNELSRGNFAQLRVVPTQQGLCTDDLVG